LGSGPNLLDCLLPSSTKVKWVQTNMPFKYTYPTWVRGVCPIPKHETQTWMLWTLGTLSVYMFASTPQKNTKQNKTKQCKAKQSPWYQKSHVTGQVNNEWIMSSNTFCPSMPMAPPPHYLSLYFPHQHGYSYPSKMMYTQWYVGLIFLSLILLCVFLLLTKLRSFSNQNIMLI
jgi:hypothetical protein